MKDQTYQISQVMNLSVYFEKHTLFFHFVMCLLTAQRIKHKNNLLCLKKGLPPFFPPLITNTIIYGILNCTNNQDHLQSLTFLIVFKDPIANETLITFSSQQKLGWTHLLIGRIVTMVHSTTTNTSRLKNPTKAFHSLIKKK